MVFCCEGIAKAFGETVQPNADLVFCCEGIAKAFGETV